MFSRRYVLTRYGLAALASRSVRPKWSLTQDPFAAFAATLSRLERSSGGRLGVALADAGTRAHVDYRGDELFPLCSTFKVLLVAAVLRRVDQGKEQLSRTIRLPTKPLLSNSPLTEEHAGDAMEVASLCEAVLTRSDNTATNLLLESLSGPTAITSFARSIGDRMTRLDRWETSLNEARAGDPRDTTTPHAMLRDLNTLLLGGVLQIPSRNRLVGWMKSNNTGLERLRKGLPSGWQAADKTGSNGEDTSNHVAVFWRPNGAPLIATAYITQCPGPELKRAEMLATIGRLIHRMPF